VSERFNQALLELTDLVSARLGDVDGLSSVVVAAAGAVAYARTPVRRGWARARTPRERAFATVAVPALMAFTDAAKMAGYAAGLAERRRSRSPDA